MGATQGMLLLDLIKTITDRWRFNSASQECRFKTPPKTNRARFEIRPRPNVIILKVLIIDHCHGTAALQKSDCQTHE